MKTENINHKFNSVYLYFTIAICLLVFILLAIAIVHHPEGLSWEISLLLIIHSTATPQLNIFASLFTKLGIYWGVTPIVILLVIWLSAQKRWRSLIYVTITTLGSIMISHLAKLSFHRPRPHLWDLFYPLPSDYAFPSGHAISSMTLIVILTILTWRSRWCKWVLILGGLFVLIIGWTRLYLGVHYPSDILAGWILAIIGGITVNLLIKKLPHNL